MDARRTIGQVGWMLGVVAVWGTIAGSAPVSAFFPPRFPPPPPAPAPSPAPVPVPPDNRDGPIPPSPPPIFVPTPPPMPKPPVIPPPLPPTPPTPLDAETVPEASTLLLGAMGLAGAMVNHYRRMRERMKRKSAV